MKDFILLFHHHAIVYRDGNGAIHAPSFIARWLNALAEHFGEIRLLMYEGNVPLPQQDEIIDQPNVTLWSLGPPGKMWDRVPRMRRLREVCRRASENADGLLIRGSTPRQMSVWKAVNVPSKAFLLVGSLLQSRPVLRFDFWNIYEYFMIHWRKAEILKIGHQGILLANSPNLVDELEDFGVHAIFVPTNSISINDFPPLQIRELCSPRRLLFCGRVVPEKGMTELFYALADLNKNQIYHLDIIGPVSDSFQQELNNLANRLSISEKVHWHGWIPFGKELMHFYQNADVFVLPTYFEGFPHVIWEAAANSCPVITTNVGGIPSLWKHGEYGLLIPPRDSSSITKAIHTLINDYTLRSMLIKNAYEHAKNYTVESCVGQLAGILNLRYREGRA